MEAIQKVYLVGLGAVGSAYAAKMNEAEPDLVKVIVDQERYEAYRDQEIRVNGQPCRFTFIPPEQATEKADLILIAVKGHHLADANALIRPFVGEKTIIMSLLNGITSEEEIGKVYGPEKLLHAFVVSTDATREGRSTRYSNLGRIVFGDKDDPASPKVSAVKALFDRTGVPYSNPPDILRELWWKFMLNVGVNQVSAVLKAPYGVFHKVKEARELDDHGMPGSFTDCGAHGDQSDGRRYRRLSWDHWRVGAGGKDFDAPGRGSGPQDGSGKLCLDGGGAW